MRTANPADIKVQAEEFRIAFSLRLYAMLVAKGGPVSGHGRLDYVAQLFGISIATAQKWLTGKSLPEPHRWREMCNVLGCSLDELFLGNTPFDPGLASRTYIEMLMLDGVVGTQLVTRKIFIEEADDRRSSLRGKLLFKIADSLMHPFLSPNDYAIIDTSITSPDLSSVMVLALNGQLIARRVQKRITGETLLIPENTRYVTDVLTPESIEKFSQDKNAPPLFVGTIIGRILLNH